MNTGLNSYPLGGCCQFAITIWRHLRQLVPFQVFDTQCAKHIINDRVGHLDVLVAFDHPSGLEGLEGEGVDEFLQWHSVLETLGHCDGETTEDPLESCPFFGQVDEDLAEGPIFVFARSQVDLVATNTRFLKVPSSTRRQHEARRLHPLGIGLGG